MSTITKASKHLHTAVLEDDERGEDEPAGEDEAPGLSCHLC